MPEAPKDRFSEELTVFHGVRLPEPARPAGYAALIDHFDLQVPLPAQLFAIGRRHRKSYTGQWSLLTPRHAPEATVVGHLTFALKYEAIDLLVLKRLFQRIGYEAIVNWVVSSPTSAYARRAWFLFEWLTGTSLDLPDAIGGKYVPIVDPARQFTVEGKTVTRQRVRNNLPGTPEFCPLVSRTQALEKFLDEDLPGRAREVAARMPKDILARTAAFLLLADSRASFAIEGERPPQDRIRRWGQAIGEAGHHPLDLDELLRLQLLVVGDTRFLRPGLRQEGGFVGEHDRVTGMPLPEHISARPDDLASLLDGLLAFSEGAARVLDPVIAAAVLSFGFVYMHPFEDGNGRIHRYLIHHVLANSGFNPPGLVFPVSSAILGDIQTYRAVLQSYSSRLLPLLEWAPTEDGNVKVLNDTADFYRYFNATAHAEFLFQCVRRTIEHDLPEEARFLQGYDAFCTRVQALVDMPAHTLDLLFRFLHQNEGKLSKRGRSREFSALTDEEVTAIERFYRNTFQNLKE